MSQGSVELPKYRCHKIVRAAKITAIDPIDDLQQKLTLGEIAGYMCKGNQWCEKHTPAVGGYYVLYDDGYDSFSPAQAFEDGYTKI